MLTNTIDVTYASIIHCVDNIHVQFKHRPKQSFGKTTGTNKEFKIN